MRRKEISFKGQTIYVGIARSLAHISLALVKNDKDYVPA